MVLVCVNGKIVSDTEASFSLYDRGFLYGGMVGNGKTGEITINLLKRFRETICHALRVFVFVKNPCHI